MGTTEHDTARKAIMKLIRIADTAAKASDTLKEKLQHQTLANELRKIDKTLKLNCFSIEEAIIKAKQC